MVLNVALSMNIWCPPLPSGRIIYSTITPSNKSSVLGDISYRLSNSPLYIVLLLVFLFFMPPPNYIFYKL